MRSLVTFMLLVNSLIAIYFGLHVLTGCSIDGEQRVSGGTTNTVQLVETFCDPATYPTVQERRVCKDALLAVLSCKADTNAP